MDPLVPSSPPIISHHNSSSPSSSSCSIQLPTASPLSHTSPESLVNDYKRPVPGNGETSITDESFFDALCSIQRISDIFATGNPSEIERTVPEIKILCEHCYDGFIDIVLPSISDNLAKYSTSLKKSIGQELLSLSKVGIGEGVAKLLTTVALQILQDSQGLNTREQPSVQSLYGEILSLTIPSVEWESKEYMRLLRVFDEYIASHNPKNRLMAIKVLSGMCSLRADRDIFDSLVLPRLWNALPDVESFVTGSALKSLSLLPVGISNSVIHNRLWNEIVKVWDKDVEVDPFGKAEAVEAASEICKRQHLEGNKEKNTINDAGLSNFYRSVCRFAVQTASKDMLFVRESHRRILVAVASELGPLTAYFPNEIELKLLKASINAFYTLSTCNDPEIKQKCAFNLPGVSASLGGRCKTVLVQIAHLLATDEEDKIRLTVAKGLHETARHLGNHRGAPSLLEVLKILLRDDATDVQLAVAENMSTTLKTLCSCRDNLCVDQVVDHTFTHIMANRNWRGSMLAVQQLGLSARFLSAAQKKDSILPVLVQAFRDGAPPIRRAAGEAFVQVVRTLSGNEERRSASVSFCNEFRGAGCNLRRGLAETLLEAVNDFSEHTYRELFAGQLLDMSFDPVRSVRIKIASELHSLAPACQVLPEFSVVIQSLENDDDLEVSEIMKGFILRASDCVQLAKEHEAEDKRKLQCELSGDGNSMTVISKNGSCVADVGAHRSRLEIGTKWIPLRKPMSMEKRRTHSAINGVPLTRKAQEELSGAQDYASETYVQPLSLRSATPSPTVFSNGTIEELSSGNEQRFDEGALGSSAIANLFSEESHADVSGSFVTPESTKPQAGNPNFRLQMRPKPLSITQRLRGRLDIQRMMSQTPFSRQNIAPNEVQGSKRTSSETRQQNLTAPEGNSVQGAGVEFAADGRPQYKGNPPWLTKSDANLIKIPSKEGMKAPVPKPAFENGTAE